MSLDVIQEVVATKIYPALLVAFFFGLTIFIHELGHFLVAKRRGMKIERFSIGFGPKVFGWKKDGIEYRLSWFPFGGYVALPQMSPMETIEGKSDTPAEQLPPAPPLSKILVALWGPIMNIIFAVILASIVWAVGLPQPINPSVVGWVEPGSLEEQLGITPNDRIVKVNDRSVKTWTDINRLVALSRDSEVKLAIERDGQRKYYTVPAEMNKLLGVKTINLYPSGRPFARDVLPGSAAQRGGVQAGDKFLAVDGVPVTSAYDLRELIAKRTNEPTVLRVMRNGKPIKLTVTPDYNAEEKAGRIGVLLDDELEYEIIRPGPNPLKQFHDIFHLMADTAYALFHHKETGVGARSLSGPVGIMGGWWHEIKNGGVLRGVWFAVLLNLNLAILNLLPLPVLDGGHIVFALFESVFRRPLPSRLVHALSTAFAVLLISFMLYVTVFDFKRFFGFRFGGDAKPAQTNEVVPATQP